MQLTCRICGRRVTGTVEACPGCRDTGTIRDYRAQYSDFVSRYDPSKEPFGMRTRNSMRSCGLFLFGWFVYLGVPILGFAIGDAFGLTLDDIAIPTVIAWGLSVWALTKIKVRMETYRR